MVTSSVNMQIQSYGEVKRWFIGGGVTFILSFLRFIGAKVNFDLLRGHCDTRSILEVHGGVIEGVVFLSLEVPLPRFRDISDIIRKFSKRFGQKTTCRPIKKQNKTKQNYLPFYLFQKQNVVPNDYHCVCRCCH